MSDVTVPPNLWVKSGKRMVKVVLSGPEAAFLPMEQFISALFDHGVLKENNLNNISITIPHNKRKRCVYGDVSFTHRQSFTISYKNEKLQFLLIDPCDKRHLVTLLHMPIETTREAITYIFSSFGCDTSDIRLAPGTEYRHDRWQLLIHKKDLEKVPENFVLPNMGPEGEHLRIKVFLEGRKPTTNLKQNKEPEMNSQQHATTSQAHSSSITDSPEQTASATPINQPPPTTSTPTARPRPTPSPRDEQPFLKRKRQEESRMSSSDFKVIESLLKATVDDCMLKINSPITTLDQTGGARKKTYEGDIRKERNEMSENGSNQRSASDGGENHQRIHHAVSRSAGDRASDWREANRKQYDSNCNRKTLHNYFQ